MYSFAKNFRTIYFCKKKKENVKKEKIDRVRMALDPG
jgi:hypothetical protein